MGKADEPALTRVYVALGSNLGDRAGHLCAALDALRATPGVRVRRCSTFHETAPVGGPPGQGPYLNAVAELETDLPPRVLLERLQDIERACGRVRGARDDPRTLDPDLLIHGERSIDEPGLVLPHPRMWQRSFVLAPLAELRDLEALRARLRDAST